MKKLIVTLATLAVVAGSLQKTSAGDREWATTGKILTGVVTGAVIAKAIQPAPMYAYPTATYYLPPTPPPVYAQPAPVVIYAPPVCARQAPVVVCAPRPVVRFSIGFGGGYSHRPHHRFCR